MERETRRSEWNHLGIENRGTLEGSPRQISPVPDVPSAIPGLGQDGRTRTGLAGLGRGSSRQGRARLVGVLHRRHLRGGEKRGLCVGATKRGKGTKIMAVTDRAGLPVAIHLSSASPHEVTLVGATLEASFVEERPERLIGDKAYDSDPLDRQLAELGIELIAPNRSNHKKTQDGRPLRRYKRRWKVERLFAWLQNYRRILTRFEYYADNYRGFVLLGCIIILLRHL